MADIKIYGVLVNDTTEGIVTRANQVLDPNLGKTQESINKEVYEIMDKFKDPTISYDDTVTKESTNAVQSRAIFKFVDDATKHTPYVGDDGYVYVWDLDLGEYRRTDTNLTGPAGETGGTVHLIFETTLLKVNNLGQMYPSSPLRVRVVKQYGETGLDPYKDGCVKWWFNGIENENKPDGWIGWSESEDEEYGEIKGVESGTDMSEFNVPINPDHVDTITFVLYIDKAGTKAFDQQNIFVIRDPAIYKLDLTNENSMVPMCDENGNVDDAYFETSQAILYHGAEQVPFEDITYSIVSHEGLKEANITEEGIITVSGWLTEWSVVNVQVCAEYAGNKFYASYSITRVSGVTIYRLQPSATNVKKHKDGTFSVDSISANVFRVEASNSGGVSSKIDSYAAEGLKVIYTYNNKVETLNDIYELANTEESIPVHGDKLPSTLDGEVSEIDIYVIKASQPITTKIDLFIDHETVPVVEDGDDGFMIFLSNESSTVNCKPDGTQVGSLWNTQAILMKGIDDYSDKCKWDFTVEPANGLSSAPTWATGKPGYLQVAGCVMDKNVDQVSIYIKATYPATSGNEFTKAYTITKAKQGEIGESGFKSTVFIRTNKTPDRPLNNAAGGSYENPVPTHYATAGGEVITHPTTGERLKWSDGIPFEPQDAQIWASSRLFTTTMEGLDAGSSTQWSEPARMSDTSTFDVEFTWFDPYIGDPDTDPDSWFDPVNDADVFREHSMVFMATKQIANGEPIMHESQDGSGNETAWTIVRILGEKGESTLRSMVFARCASKPSTPEGGTIENPLPDPNPASDGTTWSDGMPGGDPLHPIWTSMRTFSSLEGLGTDWSEPMIIKDVPGQFDVQYSTVKDEPGNPTDNPGNWYDPEDPDVTVEMQTNTWWMAQRWCGIEWANENGEPDWSPWDIIRIRGENGNDGKDGSKAVPRMRGNWEELPYGDGKLGKDGWILSGFTHEQYSENTGELITVEEEFQDVVYATAGETKECYKCLISHQKSDDYNPALAQYDYEEKTQSWKSRDGYWLKAEKYTFLATDLLNAEQVLAGVISANKEVILGDVTGHWKGTAGKVYTQVITENGMIEFKYSRTGGESADEWKTLVDIGWDTDNEYGVLRFYDPASGQCLYNLGPEGLSAQTLQSPFRKTQAYWNGDSYHTESYNCYGVIFEEVENAEFYNSTTGLTPIVPLSTKLLARSEHYSGYKQSWVKVGSGVDKNFMYNLLEEGTAILQMTLPFAVMKSIPDYDVIDYSPATGDPLVQYPPNDPLYTFGGNTIGYLALKYPKLMYQSIGFSWENGTPPSYGILTKPVRKWVCRCERLTGIPELTWIEDGAYLTETNGEEFDIGFYATDFLPFSAVVEGVETSGNSNYTYVTGVNFSIKLKTDDGNGFSSLGLRLTKYLIDIGGNSSNTYDPSYITITKEGDDSPLYESTNCLDIINEAISIVGQTFSSLVNHSYSAVHRNGTGIGAYMTLNYGVQQAFWNSCRNNTNYLSSIYVAKNILTKLLHYYSNTEEAVGYVFPETQQFKLIDPEGIDPNYLEIESTTISVNIDNLISGIEYYSLNDDDGWGNIKSIGVPVENRDNTRSYLMLDTLSSCMGSSYPTEGLTGTGNTYAIYMNLEEIELENEDGSKYYDFKINITYKAIDKFSAFLEPGIWEMPLSYGKKYYTWEDNNLLMGTWRNAKL